jgi:hypothetical protein
MQSYVCKETDLNTANIYMWEQCIAHNLEQFLGFTEMCTLFSHLVSQ